MFSSHNLRKVRLPVNQVDSAFLGHYMVTCQFENGLAMVSDSHCAEVHSELNVRHIPNLWEVDCISSLAAGMDDCVTALPCLRVVMNEKLSQYLKG